ncbi:hypothetical protein C2G38_2157852 [Gigaspora rosea]|uniref:Uncharacterized protein n=1 Tax=Gigaspora rosea TaxID=44941 RepID=A0A397W851_9GLOM|nr:hypothetical protein C2G38_2157852 [Gigaspora rosea]
MPFIGNPIQFSPFAINLLCHKEIVRPDPKISDHTTPTSKWTIPIPKDNDVDMLVFVTYHANSIKQNSNSQVVYYSDAIDLESTDLSKEYIAENKSKGWALKENQAYGVRGGRKRMSENVKGLLERFFLNGNLNVRDRMIVQEMHDELYKFVESGEINEEDIPKVSTIKGWIATYSRALKRNTTLLVIQQTSSD